MKKNEPEYCIVSGNMRTHEWDKKDFDENDGSENEMNSIKPKDNKSVNYDELIRGTGYTTYI